MIDDLTKANTPQLVPDSQFPEDALKRTVQEQPKPVEGATGGWFTLTLASAADAITAWGRDVRRRDRQLADFWPTEPYLAGTMASISFRNSTLDWEIKGGSDRVIEAVTNMLNSAVAGDTFGWVPFIERISQDLYGRDNGAFIEIIRDPGLSERFQNENAPCVGIAHLDSLQCQRTGNIETPVLYTDRDGGVHKLKWYQVIPLVDYPSSIEKMNGVGYSAVTRALRLAQIMRSIFLFKDEKISGRHIKSIHFVSGVSRTEIADEVKRVQAAANNEGMVLFTQPAVLASLDPEKPVSTATIDMASLPEGFSLDEEMKWYVSGLALGFGVDYQEIAPLPSGNIGSASQSMILHRKGSGKNPAKFMRRTCETFKNYGVLPRGCTMQFNDKNEQEELERQEVRTGAQEELAIAVNSHQLSPEAAARIMVRRGLWDEKDVVGLEEFWKQFEKNPEGTGQPVGDRGGNTIREDAGRQDKGKKKPNAGAALRKFRERFGL